MSQLENSDHLEPNQKKIKLSEPFDVKTNLNLETKEDEIVGSKSNKIKEELNNTDTQIVEETNKDGANPKTEQNAENIPEGTESKIPLLSSNSNENISDEQPMSKRKRKKLIKLQQWEIKKVQKRKQEREKLRKKKQEAIENGLPYKTGPSRKALKHLKMSDSSCSVTVAIDLSFDHLMIDKDIAKVVKQMLRIYTLNRRAANPIQLAFTSLKTGGKMHAAISKHDGYENWDVRIEEKPFQEIFPHSKICYLTSESDNILTTLEPDGVYIIGGLVDHNSHKGLCFETAKAMNLKHAQLPLDQLLKMNTRRVLTINHVFEILLLVTEGKSWTESFLQVLPSRKGAKPVDASPDKPTEDIQK